MDEFEIISKIPFRVDYEKLLKQFHLKADSSYDHELRQMIDEAEKIGQPKALYRVAYIDERDENSMVINGVKLTSRVLNVNTAKIHRVFVFLVTCGAELQNWSDSIQDMLQKFWADEIKLMALTAAMKILHEQLDQKFVLGQTASMSPGSLSDWPLIQQKPLFQILGDEQVKAIGVQLTDSYLMIPNKTVSGIRFSTEIVFESCQLCPREKCSGRRAPYDKQLYENKYQIQSS